MENVEKKETKWSRIKEIAIEQASEFGFLCLVLPFTATAIMFLMTPVLLLWKKLGLEKK